MSSNPISPTETNTIVNGFGAGPLHERELTLSRLLDAPRARVFATWTTRLPEWWGPYGMSMPVCEMDLRPGGIFRTVMRAPDGKLYRTKGVFLEILVNERIVFTDAFEPKWSPSPNAFFTAISTFEDFQGKTKYTVQARHWSTMHCEKHRQMGFHQGWDESLDRLAALLSSI
jgi:uncharacterized protein YndB with AHSA1/START domain